MSNIKILTLFRERRYTERYLNEPSIEDNKFGSVQV